MRVFLALLSERINDETLPLDGRESLTLLFQNLFAWENGNQRNNLIDLAATAGLEAYAGEVEDSNEKSAYEPVPYQIKR